MEDRYKMLLNDLSGKVSWIISGSMDSWCEPFLPLFQLAVFLYAPTEIRISRLKDRELKKYGNRILAGGDMELHHKDFLNWALQYDDGQMAGRSLKRHEEWITTLPCPVLRIEGDYPVEIIIKKIRNKLLELGFY